MFALMLVLVYLTLEQPDLFLCGRMSGLSGGEIVLGGLELDESFRVLLRDGLDSLGQPIRVSDGDSCVMYEIVCSLCYLLFNLTGLSLLSFV